MNEFIIKISLSLKPTDRVLDFVTHKNQFLMLVFIWAFMYTVCNVPAYFTELLLSLHYIKLSYKSSIHFLALVHCKFETWCEVVVKAVLVGTQEIRMTWDCMVSQVKILSPQSSTSVLADRSSTALLLHTGCLNFSVKKQLVFLYGFLMMMIVFCYSCIVWTMYTLYKLEAFAWANKLVTWYLVALKTSSAELVYQELVHASCIF